jgi:hypothetical protein
MTYQLTFNSRIGLWELQILGRCIRRRFFRSRYGAERLIVRYRRMLQVAS